MLLEGREKILHKQQTMQTKDNGTTRNRGQLNQLSVTSWNRSNVKLFLVWFLYYRGSNHNSLSQVIKVTEKWARCYIASLETFHSRAPFFLLYGWDLRSEGGKVFCIISQNFQPWSTINFFLWREKFLLDLDCFKMASWTAIGSFCTVI